MKYLIILTFAISLSTAMASADTDTKDCLGQKSTQIEFTQTELFEEVDFLLGYENVDWTVDDKFQGGKVILKLHTRAKSNTEASDGKTRYETKYIIADIDFTASLGQDGMEYSYLKFKPISKEEALTFQEGDGIKIINKVVSYAEFTLKKDLPIGQKLYASFEPVHYKTELGVAITKKVQFELSGQSGIGFSYAQSTNDAYDDVQNFYVDLQAGFRIKHREYGAFRFDYGVKSGVIVQNIRPGSPQATSREGRVRGTYEFKLADNTDCGIYAEKRSFQINPGYNEEEQTKQERLYEKAKTYGFNCESHF